MKAVEPHDSAEEAHSGKRGTGEMFTNLSKSATIAVNIVAGVEKIISGAQSGADRAALDFAIAHRIPHGGWCPRGRKAEDGTIDPRYELQETPNSSYIQRTEWNTRDSDGTVVFSIAPVLSGGSKKTVALAHNYDQDSGLKTRRGRA